ncbi:efflux transporter outer membrane subunit [Sulfitobacter sp.]|uniref:efflux transporter outer membrane subunit n=1 Tax=Sulfitobacter sp. TaxID=1903071 RepID=UPI003299D811
MKPYYLAMGLLLAGCAVGTDYQRPEVSVETRFVEGNAQAIGEVAQQKWWLNYKDATLNSFIDRGLAQNLDIQSALEAIRQAQAELRQTGVNASLDGSLTAGVTTSGGDLVSGSSTSESADLGASWVIDLFGGIRREREAAAASLAGSRDDAETVRLAWLAELVSAYSNARYNQEAMALTRTTIKTRQETVNITKSQFEAGASTEYELAEAQALLSTARADLPEFAAAFDSNVFAIATLLNEPSSKIVALMQKGSPQLPAPRDGATGVPADLLRNRPDVRSAEADLAAAVGDLGVAEAALYPALSLTGSIDRLDSTDTWSFGPELTLPVFNRGLLKAQRDAQISIAKQAEITWRSAINDAVEDVQVAQSSLSRNRERVRHLRTAANDYGRALSLARENFRNGAITLLDLLDTDREANTAKISAASAVNDAAQSWATLKIVIGAGAGVTGATTN